MSNRDRLEQAGILDPNKNLSNQQYEAIEDLSEEEVDQLISTNEHLMRETGGAGPMVNVGINQTEQIQD